MELKRFCYNNNITVNKAPFSDFSTFDANATPVVQNVQGKNGEIDRTHCFFWDVIFYFMAYASPSDLSKSLSMKYLPSLRFFAGQN